MIIFEQSYDEEGLLNFEDSVYDAINRAIYDEVIRADDCDQAFGTFTVMVTWKDEEHD